MYARLEALLSSFGVKFRYESHGVQTEQGHAYAFHATQKVDSWTHQAYTCYLVRNGKRYSFPYRTGLGWRTGPHVTDLVTSLLLDMSGIEQPFEDWASDLGYSTDSRAAERTYRACKAIARKLARIFTPEELEAIRDAVEADESSADEDWRDRHHAAADGSEVAS